MRVSAYWMSYELPGLPKGLNGSHSHWRVAAAEKKRWRVMSALVARSKRPPKPLASCSIRCTRFSSSEPDYDNLAASFKAIIDGLKDAGVIEDDRSTCIVKREYLWEKTAPKKGMVRIEVWAMNDML